MSQCTYRCVVLPDRGPTTATPTESSSLNAPTGAWCSLTSGRKSWESTSLPSQCTYRCVVLPDSRSSGLESSSEGGSQCTYRCVVLPDASQAGTGFFSDAVSMHLQVRGAP